MNKYIDHTCLKQTATGKEIISLCKEAIKYKFKAVCIAPIYVKLAKNILKDTEVSVCTVIGFPFGYNTTESKTKEIIEALDDGADELDIVQCVSHVKNGEYYYINLEMACLLHEIYKNSGSNIPAVKVILESGILTDEEIINCCEIYSNYAAREGEYSAIHFLKTSTGYAERGASVHHVELIRKHTNPLIEIKASGGIRDRKFAEELIKSGATRIGCSSGVKIMEEYSTLNTISDRVKKCINNLIDGELNDEMSFMVDLGFDDLDYVEMIMEIEKEFNICITDEQAEKIITVGDVIKFIENKCITKQIYLQI